MAEVASLVMGAIPIIMEGVRYYLTVTEKVQAMRKYQQTLKQFERSFEIEGVIFQGLWTHFSRYPEELQQRNIKPSIDHIRTRMEKIMDEIVPKLHKYEENQEGFAKMMASLHFTLTETYLETKVRDIRQLNDTLFKLLAVVKPQAPATNPTNANHRGPRQKNNVGLEMQRVQEDAQSLYRMCDIIRKVILSSSQDQERMFNALLELQMHVFNEAVLKKKNAPHKVILVISKASSNSSQRQVLDFTMECSEDAGVGLAVEEEDSPLGLLQGLETSRGMHPPTPVPGTKLMKPGQLLTVMRSIPLPHGSRNGRLIVSMVRGVKSSSSRMIENTKMAFSLRSAPRGEALFHAPKSPISQEPPSITGAMDIIDIHQIRQILADNKGRKEERVWVPKQGLPVPHSGKEVTLAELLPIAPSHMHQSRGKQRLYGRENSPALVERLKLAVKLASSMFQLQGTGWLHCRWGKSDILFIQEENSQRPNLSNPFVRWSQAIAGSSAAADNRSIWAEAADIPCNQDLFSLGILLIELWMWESIETMEDAWRLLREMRGNSPAGYSNAAALCFGDLGYGGAHLSLHRLDFKNSAYERIMQPLEETLKNFCGVESLEKVFGTQVS